MRRIRKEQGHILVFGVFLILTLLAGLGYMYEVGRITTAKIQAQNATDAAAMAAAVEMANYRNIATAHYALADMWYNMARRAAEAEYLLYAFGALMSFVGDELGPRPRRSTSSWAQTAVLAATAGYHLFFHIQDGAVTRFLATYGGKRFYSHWLRADARGQMDPPNGGFATDIASVLGAIPGVGIQDVDPGKYKWRKERMRQAALIASLYNVMDPYDGAPLPRITVGNGLWDTFGNLLGDVGSFFGSIDNILDFVNAVLSNLLNPSAWLSAMPGTDPYTRVFGVSMPSFGEEGKDDIPPRNFHNQIRNSELGSTYTRGLFLIPGSSIGRKLLFLANAGGGPTPALPDGLAGLVMGQLMNLSDILRLGQVSGYLPPEVLNALPIPIITRAAATERPFVIPEVRLLDVVGEILGLLFNQTDQDWALSDLGDRIGSIPVVGNYINDLVNPIMFYNDPWWYPTLAPAAGNIQGPNPDAYPYH